MERTGLEFVLEVGYNRQAVAIVEGSVASFASLSKKHHVNATLPPEFLDLSNKLGSPHQPSVGRACPIVKLG